MEVRATYLDVAGQIARALVLVGFLPRRRDRGGGTVALH